jgi:hypothetical protein
MQHSGVTQVALLKAISRREQRHVWLARAGVGLMAASLALAAAGCGGSSASSSPSGSSKPAAGSSSPASSGPWKLIVATVAGGLDLNSNAVSSGAYDNFKPELANVNKKIGSAGHATSAVFGIYNLKAQTSPTEVPPLLIYAGLNGSFSPQAIISKAESSAGAGTFHTVSPGPHGGDAVCGSSGSGASAEDVCIWATSTDYATVFVYGKATKAVTSLPDLMVSMRNQLEVPK